MRGNIRRRIPRLNLITLSPNRRYIIRSVSPDSHKIDVDQYANTKLDPRLLEAMAFDIGSIHAADPAILVAIQQDMDVGLVGLKQQR